MACPGVTVRQGGRHAAIAAGARGDAKRVEGVVGKKTGDVILLQGSLLTPFSPVPAAINRDLGIEGRDGGGAD